MPNADHVVRVIVGEQGAADGVEHLVRAFDGRPNRDGEALRRDNITTVRVETKSGSAGSGSIQVNGASALENVFVLDGVDATDLNQGQLRSANAIPCEFIGEIQIETGGYEAEFGGALGGVINVRSEGGSNTFHGEINTQFTSNLLNSRPRGFWQASPASASAADFFAPKEDKYRTVYPGFNQGGALIENRLFFFQGIQATFTRREGNIAYAAPTGARANTRRRRLSISRFPGSIGLPRRS